MFDSNVRIDQVLTESVSDRFGVWPGSAVQVH